ncbi:hypothetical protein [Plebeiibacterium marinum]|uniref:Iron-only hydrogenase system regulator n=1 Tax=Plebeiibacterium marinum TaxID=2992111 RepID=A0AAE3MGZ5_9BACT|nr:hypothetical protein [Plebeiobacterium marinum]MCW3807300.1 hypothetical protein [Plebeiobacterium marinum]
MANSDITILGVSVYDRTQEAGEVQNVLTKYGCSIKTRLGMHEVSNDFCSKSGLIILELFGEMEEQEKLETSLKQINGVEVQKMVFGK